MHGGQKKQQRDAAAGCATRQTVITRTHTVKHTKRPKHGVRQEEDHIRLWRGVFLADKQKAADTISNRFSALIAYWLHDVATSWFCDLVFAGFRMIVVVVVVTAFVDYAGYSCNYCVW